MDRSQDPAPFAWIFAGAVALVGLGAAVVASRSRTLQREAPLAGRPTGADGAPAEVEELLGRQG